MVRWLAVTLCLISSVPQGAWAAAAHSVQTPQAPVAAVPTLPQALPAVSQGLTDAPQALPAAAAASASALQTGSAPSFAAPKAEAPTAAIGLTEAAAAAAALRSHPSGDDGDSARADFTERRADVDGGDDVPEAISAAPARLSAPSSAREAGKRPTPPSPRVGGFLGGVFGAQVANNALNVTLPLALMSVGQPLSHALGLTALTTAFDMAGTLAGGWLVGRLPSRTALAATTAVRAATLGGAAALLAAGLATAPLLVALFSLDAAARGTADTLRNTAAVDLVGKDKADLDRLNASSQTAFYAGGIVGPLAAIPLLAMPGLWAHWFVAGAFAAAAAAYLRMPRAGAAAPPAGPAASPSARPWYRDRTLLAGVLGLVLASLMPALRAQLPVLFTESTLHAASDAAKLALAFGLGSTAGSLLYRRVSAALTPSRWLAVGALGTLGLGAAWMTGAFLPVAGGILLFAAASAMAQLAATGQLQSRLPAGAEGAAMGSARFGANLISVLLRLAIPAVVAAALSPAASLPWIATGLGGLGVVQLWVSGVLPPRVKRAVVWAAATAGLFAAARHFPGHGAHFLAAGALATAPVAPAAPPAQAASRPSPVTGYPGRLIVVEGLDGSGKSTQLELLKQYFEAQGRKVVVTSWNSSDLIADAVKKAKRQQALTPRTFALLNAADFADRVEHVIKPALEDGSIVLADRWYYTALARDSVRGNDPQWLRGLYSDALKPDIALYFKLPVPEAIKRVLNRAGGKVGLSEDFDETDPRRKVLGQNFYAAGRDMRFAEDDLKNFQEFQSRVAASYDGQIKEFGLRPFDAARGRDEQQQAVLQAVLSEIGPLESFKKAPPRDGGNLFDKDPAGDDEKLRGNYLRAKKGLHFYFRNMLLQMQERFAQLMDNDSMPRVFLHANMHVDNYAKTGRGAAMIDYDRARIGPYAEELLRTLVSLSLRQKKPVAGALVDPSVSKALLDGYTYGLENPDRPFSEARIVKNVPPVLGERSMNEYLANDGKWAKEMRSRPLAADHADVVALVKSYAKGLSRRERLLKRYKIEEAGLGEGSMGQRKIYLVVLAPRDKRSKADRILLNIKQSRTDPDTRLYKNPFSTEIERLTFAAKLYAPDMEPGTGGAVLDGVEYGVRRLPAQNVKIKKMLSVEDQRDLAYAAGTQAGRAHARWLAKQGQKPSVIEKHLKAHYQEIVAAGLVIRNELAAAHERYLKKMKEKGLEPKDDEDDDE